MASQIGPLTKQEAFVADDNPVMIPTNIVMNNFTRSTDSMSTITVFWGVQDINRAGDSMWDSEFIGEAILDDSFSASSEESQQYLLELCADMKTKWFIKEGTVRCWIEEFRAYLLSKGSQFPVAEADFEKKLNIWTKSELAGKTFRSTKALGFVNDKLVYMEFEGKSNVSLREPSDTK